jgi:hypothetical protein
MPFIHLLHQEKEFRRVVFCMGKWGRFNPTTKRGN